MVIDTKPRDIRAFGDALIQTQDLDPVYSAIWAARLDHRQLERLLLAYWCFYHLGFAAWVSEYEGDGFWQWMKIAAANEEGRGPRDLQGCVLSAERWPRGTERRHFRGTKCERAVYWFATRQGGSDNETFNQSPPEHWVRHLCNGPQPLTEKAVMEKVQKWPLCGPWIAFKAADMLERVYGAPIVFDRNIGLMYSEPAAGLKLLCQEPALMAADRTPETVYNRLLTYFSPRPAPPGHDRGCGPQEVETILCKWKSMLGGHYHVGKDIREVRHGLAGWGETAERMLRTCPVEVS